MEPTQADRDARVERILEELDHVEAEIDELQPASRARNMVVVLLTLLVTVASVLAFFMFPGSWDLAPFLIAAVGYGIAGWISISAKNEKLAELKQERARLTAGGSTA